MLHAFPSWHVLAVDVNDLYPGHRKLDGQGSVHVGRRGALFGFFHIPLVKRAFSMVSNVLFVFVQVFVFFRPLCGGVSNWDHALALWVVSVLIEEVHQMFADWHLYCQSWALNLLDFLRAILGLVAVVLRYMLAYEPWLELRISSIEASDLTDWITKSRLSQGLDDAPTRGNWYHTDHSRVGTLMPADDCPWSWEMELLRLVGAMLVLVSTGRLIEARRSAPTQTARALRGAPGALASPPPAAPVFG